MGDVFDALVRAGQRDSKPLPGTRPDTHAGSEPAPPPEPADAGALPWNAAEEAVSRQDDPLRPSATVPLGELSDADLEPAEPPAPVPITRPTSPPVVISGELEVPRPRPGKEVRAAPPPTAAELARQQMLLQQYRSVRDALIQRGRDKGWKLHLFTCPTGRDGRAATVFNLGQTFSERAELRILLVEAELRGPSFHRFFQRPFTPGLAQLLRGQLARIDAAIHPTRFDNVDVLPAGDCEFAANRDLLTGQAMLSLLQELKGRYDHVLIDAPSVAIDDGTQELASFADETLLVARMRTTPSEQIERAKRTLRAAGAPVGGVIMSHG